MLTVFKFPDVLSNWSPSNTRVTLDIHIVTQSKDNGLDLSCQFTCRREHQCLGFPDSYVDGLENRDGEGCSFTGTGLCLSNDIPSLSYRENSALLDGGGFFKIFKDFQNVSSGWIAKETYCMRICRGVGLPSGQDRRRLRPQRRPLTTQIRVSMQKRSQRNVLQALEGWDVLRRLG